MPTGKKAFYSHPAAMSKKFRIFLLSLSALVLILQFFNKSAAQDINVHLAIDPEHSFVHAKAVFLNDDFKPLPLSFLSDYAGIRLPVDRISNLKHDGNAWSYDVSIAAMNQLSATAHVSWLSPDFGILMLEDLLPQLSQNISAKVDLGVLASEKRSLVVNTSEVPSGDGTFFVTNVHKAVFYLSLTSLPSTRENRSSGGRMAVNTYNCGTGLETLGFSMEIADRYAALFGMRQEPAIGFWCMSGREAIPQWEGEARGSSVTIVAAGTMFPSQFQQGLHEQLRHEMFHLWIPEGTNLTGHYDWFYEGFAVYQSLKLGVAVNRIRFDDYLDTLSRAYDIDKRLGGKLSLINASRNRWNGDNNTVIYARGMLVAFLCDMALMNASKSKISSDDIVREVYRRHSGDAPATDGNDAVISILKQHRELIQIVDDHVSGTKQIDWSALIATAGLRADTVGGVTTLKVVQKPSGSQKRLLDKLGYNNWRKVRLK